MKADAETVITVTEMLNKDMIVLSPIADMGDDWEHPTMLMVPMDALHNSVNPQVIEIRARFDKTSTKTGSFIYRYVMFRSGME